LNAGFEGAIVVGKVREQKEGVGFDVVTEEYRDMFDAGIIDPTKVTRAALLNAVSIAGMLLTTDALVAEIKEDEAPMAPPMPGGMPY
jgi:chaperonin GroEL